MSTKIFSKSFKLGLIKGGQLARMLIQSGLNYTIATHVMDSDEEAPCRHICDHFFKGDSENFYDVHAFGRGLDLLTFEFENVNVDALRKLQSEGVAVHPSPDILAIVQDKGLQKEFYRKNNIPTADFVLIDSVDDILKHPQLIPGIQKLRRSGYDGRGVVPTGSTVNISKMFSEPSVLEAKIDFQCEVSVIVARGHDGQMAAYPAVQMESHPEANQLEFLFAPAEISSHVAHQAEEIARHVAQALGLVGILAVEMFVTRDGKVLVNEIAPRPHNSGHHTIEASVTSQFEQHLRAVLGLPLGSTVLRSPAAMVNLVGAEGCSGPVRYEGLEEILKTENMYVHLYGKSITKPFRKMGHITILDTDVKRLKEKARWVKQSVRVAA